MAGEHVWTICLKHCTESVLFIGRCSGNHVRRARTETPLSKKNTFFTTTTRNSVIADKARDAFVQYAMAWLTP